MTEPSVSLARVRILSELSLLDTGSDAALDRFVRIAAEASGCPYALVTFLGADRQVNKARHGIRAPYVSLAHSFCLCALDQPAILEVPDALADSRFAGNELVTGPECIRAYAGVPIVYEGIALGTVCVLDTRPHRFTEHDRRILEDLSRLVTDLLQLRSERIHRNQSEMRALDCASAAGEWLWETDRQHVMAWLAGSQPDIMALAGHVTGTPPRDAPVLDWLGQACEPRQSFKELLDLGKPFVGAVMDCTDGPGQTRYVEQSGAPFRDEKGDFAGFRGSAREVTDRVRAEILAAQTAAAERASRTKSEFLARMSHELRTPLHAILGFGQLMLLDDSEPGRPTPLQRERLETMRSAGQRLLNLINDMLDLARIEQGRAEIELTGIDVHKVVAAAETMLRPLCSERAVTLRNFIQPGEAAVLADRRALEQVLINLLSNAVKYNAPNGIVTVRLTSNERVDLIVEDNGPGMSAEQQSKLFQPLNRLGAEAGQTAGSGLGLVISKALVDLIGGELAIASAQGIGTSATVSLPRAGSVPVKALADDRVPPTARSGAGGAAGLTVLYVEDEPVNAMLMAQLFTIEPTWRLLVAETGADGIRIAAGVRSDLILIDMNLPDMSGIDVLNALAGVPGADCTKIALSADAMPEQIQRAREAGFQDYWTKPLDLKRALGELRAMQNSRTFEGMSAGAASVKSA